MLKKLLFFGFEKRFPFKGMKQMLEKQRVVLYTNLSSRISTNRQNHPFRWNQATCYKRKIQRITTIIYISKLPSIISIQNQI